MRKTEVKAIVTEINLEKVAPKEVKEYDVTFMSDFRGFEQLNVVCKSGTVFMKNGETRTLSKEDAFRLLEGYPQHIRIVPHG